MYKGLTKLATRGSVGNNESFIIDLPLRGTLDNIMLVALDASGDEVAVASELTSVSLVAGDEGQIIEPMAPADLLHFAKYRLTAQKAYTDLTGIVPIYFARMINDDENAKMAYGIGTKGLSSLTVEIETGTTTNIATIEIWGQRLLGGIFDTEGLGRHYRLSKETDTSYGTGEQEFDSFPYRGRKGVRLLSVTAKNASGTGVVKKSRVEIDNSAAPMVHTNVREFAQRVAGRTPQANYYAVDFSLLNAPNMGLPISNVSRISYIGNWSTSPAASHDMLIETLHGIDEGEGL